MTTTELYREHLETLDRHLGTALEHAGREGLALDGVLFHAGRQRYYHLDDRDITFRGAAHFRRWVPLDGPEHCVLARPGQKPLVIRVRPKDYWYDTTPPAASYWEEAVELVEVEHYEEITGVVDSLAGMAYIGNSPEAAAQAGIPGAQLEPAALMAPLDWYRAYKTPYEVALAEIAAERGAAGHRSGRDAYLAGASEIEIYGAFLAGSEQTGALVPFEPIVALDEKSSILHYQEKRSAGASRGAVLLLDAGADERGFASDLTRTWTRDDADPTFKELVRGLDRAERQLVEMVTPGRPYLEIHVEAHRLVAELLSAAGVFKGSAEDALERGLTHPFLPHGVGHHLGFQVHDVGGHAAGPAGGKVPPPSEYPYLRNTRLLEEGHYVTIEPGLYFIPLLLDPFREGLHADAVDWALVDRLIAYGGIRIEDDVLCTADGARDLTRPHIGGPDD